ncbi:hypothetical protein Zmor_016998 [Zophobas morio]|uniref:Protein takeout n=1 Tax=Zophobas morio TaxID=2755281 RepID=A0AA38I4J7_9CUCU|nr:hypothetical protein Zmor_016998 [Zophobas morio]
MLLPTLIFTLLALSSSLKLPPSFQKCNRKQPDFKECLLKAAQNGTAQLNRPVLKDFNIPNLEPVKVLEAIISSGTGPVQVEQMFRNCEVRGLYLVKFETFDWDFDAKSMHFRVFVSEVNLRCDYNLDGKVLLLPIRGTGLATIRLTNTTGAVEVKYEEVKKAHKTYAKFVSSKVIMDPKNVHFNFDNLFDGDKQLGDNINNVLNENWKEVFDDVHDGYSELVGQIFLQHMNILFSKASLEELLD